MDKSTKGGNFFSASEFPPRGSLLATPSWGRPRAQTYLYRLAGYRNASPSWLSGCLGTSAHLGREGGKCAGAAAARPHSCGNTRSRETRGSRCSSGRGNLCPRTRESLRGHQREKGGVGTLQKGSRKKANRGQRGSKPFLSHPPVHCGKLHSRSCTVSPAQPLPPRQNRCLVLMAGRSGSLQVLEQGVQGDQGVRPPSSVPARCGGREASHVSRVARAEFPSPPPPSGKTPSMNVPRAHLGSLGLVLLWCGSFLKHKMQDRRRLEDFHHHHHHHVMCRAHCA